MRGTPALGEGIPCPRLGGRPQMHIGDQQLDPLSTQLRFRGFSLFHARRGDDTITLQTEHLSEYLPHRRLILNDQDGDGWATPLRQHGVTEGTVRGDAMTIVTYGTHGSSSVSRSR